MLETDDLLVLSITPSFLAILLKAASEGPIELSDLMVGLEKLSLNDEPLSHRDARKILAKNAHIKLAQDPPSDELPPPPVGEDEEGTEGTDVTDLPPEAMTETSDPGKTESAIARAKRVLEDASIESEVKEESTTGDIKPPGHEGPLRSLDDGSLKELPGGKTAVTPKSLTLDNYQGFMMKALKKLQQSGNFNVSIEQLLALESEISHKLDAGEEINVQEMYKQMMLESPARDESSESESQVLMSRLPLSEREQDQKMTPKQLSELRPDLTEEEVAETLKERGPVSSLEYFQEGVPLGRLRQELEEEEESPESDAVQR